MVAFYAAQEFESLSLCQLHRKRARARSNGAASKADGRSQCGTKVRILSLPPQSNCGIYQLEDKRSHKPTDACSSHAPATRNSAWLTRAADHSVGFIPRGSSPRRKPASPLKLTRWKRLFEEQKGVARHHVAAPILLRSISGEITRLSTWPDGFDPRTQRHVHWGLRRSAASPCKQCGPGSLPGDSTTILTGISSVGRTPHFDCGCRRFEPCIPCHRLRRVNSAVRVPTCLVGSRGFDPRTRRQVCVD